MANQNRRRVVVGKIGAGASPTRVKGSRKEQQECPERGGADYSAARMRETFRHSGIVALDGHLADYKRYRAQRDRDEERRVRNIIEEAQAEQAANPMSVEDMLEESRRLAEYGEKQAKKLGIKPNPA